MKIAYSIILVFLLICSSCANKSNQTEALLKDDISKVESQEVDTASTPKEEKDNQVADVQSKQSGSCSSSSSHSHKSSSYDNMRGFDPASEDDMDDNGMSRYMENNDEEGWD